MIDWISRKISWPQSVCGKFSEREQFLFAARLFKFNTWSKAASRCGTEKINVHSFLMGKRFSHMSPPHDASFWFPCSSLKHKHAWFMRDFSFSHTPNFPHSDDSDQSHRIELLRSFRHPIKNFQCNSWKCATTMRSRKSAESSTCIFSSQLSLACEEAWGNYKCSCPPPPPSQFIEWDEWIKCHQTSNVSACFSSKSSTKWWVDANVEWVKSDWRCESFIESWPKVKGKWKVARMM